MSHKQWPQLIRTQQPLRQGIITEYYTTKDGAGMIRSSAPAGFRYYPWSHAHGIVENHHRCAMAHAEELEWLDPQRSGEYSWELMGGAIRGEKYAWVLLPIREISE